MLLNDEKYQQKKIKYTTEGVKERERRRTPNPALQRNSNVAPMVIKPFEERTIRKIDQKKAMLSKFHWMFLELRKMNRYSNVREVSVPLLDLTKLSLDPRKAVKTLRSIINQVQIKVQ